MSTLRALQSLRRVARRRSGITIIEILVAMTILAVGLMSLMSVWLYAFGMTRRSDEVDVAYNLARSAVERTRSMGYYYADPTAIGQWYDASQASLANKNGAYYKLDISLTTGNDAPGGNGYLNMKQVDVVVTRASDGAELCRTSSYLTLGGV